MKNGTRAPESSTETDSVEAHDIDPAQKRRGFSARKRLLLEQAEKLAAERDYWAKRHSFFYDEEWRYLRFLIPPQKRVLDLGCGNGHRLAALEPSYGVGVDFSPAKVAYAAGTYPHLNFLCDDVENLKKTPVFDEPFDVIVMSDTIGSLDDCLATFQELAPILQFGNPSRRLVLYADMESVIDSLQQSRGGTTLRSPQLAVEPRHRQPLAARRFRRDQARMENALALFDVRVGALNQSLCRDVAGHSKALHAQLCDRAPAP